MGIWDSLKDSLGFDTDQITVSTPLDTVKPVYTYTPSLWDRIFSSTSAAKVETVLTPANDTITAAGGLPGLITSTESGLKWGLILGGIVLALFLIGEFKSITRK